MNKTRLSKILDALSPDGVAVDFKDFDQSVNKLKESLKVKIEATTLQEMNRQLDKFKRGVDFAPLYKAIDAIETSLNEKAATIQSALDNETILVRSALREGEGARNEMTATLQTFREKLQAIDAQRGDITTLKSRLDAIPDFTSSITALEESLAGKASVGAITEATDAIEKLRRELTNRLNNMPHGGNANRNIAVGGNTSTLSRYTDINLKAGANVTLSYSNNNTSKYLDLTIAATGGPGGTTRSINSISTSQAAAAVAGTDYVYICTTGVQLILPDAASNTNLYTVKNTSTSSVLVSTTSAQTIDGQSTAILPIQYTAIDLISDGANWDIT